MRLNHRLGVLVLTGLMLAAAPAQAADPSPPHDRSTGRTGTHRLPDSADVPAGRCLYGYDVEGEGYYNGVRRIRVVAPVAYARAGRKSQRLAARLVIQVWKVDGWHRYAASTWQRSTATPKKRANFSARSLAVDSRPLHNVAGAWRVYVEIRWHSADGSVKGSARLYPDWYAGSEGALELRVREDFCGSTTG